MVAGGGLRPGGIHIPGSGPGQDDDLLHSCTVGRGKESRAWDAVTETVEYRARQVKNYLFALVYISG